MTMTVTPPHLATIPLKDLIAETKPGFAIGKRSVNGIKQIRMNNVDTEGNLDLTDVIRVPATDKQIASCSLEVGDVVFNNTNSTELVGKSAVFRGHGEPVTFSNHFTRIRVKRNRLDPSYLARWLTRLQQSRVFEGLCTRWVGQSAVRVEKLLELEIPLPPLPEQKRIADILDKADSIRRKRQESFLLVDQIPLAAFRESFKKYLVPEGMEEVLSKVAEVVSGVAKGRKLYGESIREVPYLRVANVQAGYLDLSEIKTIPAKESEIAALALKTGDVVMTEGGDHDKLGRGALWEHDIPECIHQNHVFRVRANTRRMLPSFFVHYLQTSLAMNYFLRCAKKTTNLASINMTQLKALPLPLPPLRLQEQFEREFRTTLTVSQRQSESKREADNLFNSLVQRAFKGEL